MDSVTLNRSTSEPYLQRISTPLLCEIFAGILAHYQQAIDEARHVKEVNMPHPSLTLSHVCRAWREAAIADPTVWRIIHIPGLSHKLVDLYLDRSKESTLAVCIDHSRLRQPRRDMESALKMLNSMARIGELRLATTDSGVQLYSHYLERLAPRLELLALHTDRFASYDGNVHLQIGILSNIEKSPLRTLRIHSIVTPWTSSIFHRLTSLSIEFPPVSPAINELLDILDSAPHLVHMTYRDRRYAPMIRSPPYRRISLLRLLSLQLEMLCYDFDCLCDNILMPSLASWTFEVLCDQPTRSLLHPSRSFPSSEQSHSLVITCFNKHLHIVAKSPSHLNESINESALTGYCGGPVPPVQVVAVIIQSHFPAHVLDVSFTIDCIEDDSLTCWAELLACFPKVQTLTLNLRGYDGPRTGMENFALALMHRSNDQIFHFYCSELSRLNIETKMSEHGWDEMAGLLNTCLSLRIQHHLPKIDLQVRDYSDLLNDPTFMAHHARVLEPVVKSLTWEEHPDEPLWIDRMGL